MILGNCADALAVGERSFAINASCDPNYWILIAANAQLGWLDDAGRWLARLYRALRSAGSKLDNRTRIQVAVPGKVRFQVATKRS